MSVRGAVSFQFDFMPLTQEASPSLNEFFYFTFFIFGLLKSWCGCSKHSSFPIWLPAVPICCHLFIIHSMPWDIAVIQDAVMSMCVCLFPLCIAVVFSCDSNVTISDSVVPYMRLCHTHSQHHTAGLTVFVCCVFPLLDLLDLTFQLHFSMCV